MPIRMLKEQKMILMPMLRKNSMSRPSTGKKCNYNGYQKYRFIKQWVTGEDAVLQEAEIMHELYTVMKNLCMRAA
jgi:hypothetical protein